MTTSIATWANTQSEEDLMNDDHAPLWRNIIHKMKETDLQNKTVLDFGCNQGGFLRMLYQLRPFKQGVGMDIATQSLETAEKLRFGMPVTFCNAGDIQSYTNQFDLAFSHEVIYLLPDLDEHARHIYETLKEGGVYYATTGCYTDMPLWEKWHDIISAYSNIAVPNHSLDDYLNAFAKAGFKVSAQRFQLDDFIPIKTERSYFPNEVKDRLDFFNDYKVIFRLQK